MKRGFTIIELLVAVSIFIIITGLVVADFRRGARSDELKIAASGLASTLQRAQTMALAGEAINGIVPAGGYGVYVTLDVPNRYIIFADNDDDKTYDAGEDLADGVNFLPSNITISQVSPASASIIFKSPKPTIYINGDISLNLAIITLKDSISNQSRKVIVNRISGQISVE
jgi:prepilin-type N-terminal cleavage/methylation domain-containing protein